MIIHLKDPGYISWSEEIHIWQWSWCTIFLSEMCRAWTDVVGWNLVWSKHDSFMIVPFLPDHSRRRQHGNVSSISNASQVIQKWKVSGKVRRHFHTTKFEDNRNLQHRDSKTQCSCMHKIRLRNVAHNKSAFLYKKRVSEVNSSRIH